MDYMQFFNYIQKVNKCVSVFEEDLVAHCEVNLD